MQFKNQTQKTKYFLLGNFYLRSFGEWDFKGHTLSRPAFVKVASNSFTSHCVTFFQSLCGVRFPLQITGLTGKFASPHWEGPNTFELRRQFSNLSAIRFHFSAIWTSVWKLSSLIFSIIIITATTAIITTTAIIITIITTLCLVY